MTASLPPLTILIFAVISLSAAAAGRQVIRLLQIDRECSSESLLFAILVGYALLAYVTAAVGLLGFLTPIVACAIIGAALLAGATQLSTVLGDIRDVAQSAAEKLASGGRILTYLSIGAVLTIILAACGFVLSGRTILVWACAGGLILLAAGAFYNTRAAIAWLLVAWLIVTMLAALAPPANHDWDGLAEHLAQAKIYADDGSYHPLWYDHHSHFPALTQMLFTIGMLLGDSGLAKLFHWAFGAVSLLFAWRIAERFVGAGAGKWAALCFAGTPLVGWLMQTGYVDLATCAYTLAFLYGLLWWWRRMQHSAALLAAMMGGILMATKMQGIAVFGVFVIAMAIRALRYNQHIVPVITTLAKFAAIAIVIAAPWYVKTWVNTGNPVYPFAYSIFGGRYWGQKEARQYAYHQKRFGVGRLAERSRYWRLRPLQRLFSGPRSPVHLLAAPWNITFNPVPFTVHWRRGNKAVVPVLMQFWVGPIYLLSVLGLGGLWLNDRLRWCRGAEDDRPVQQPTQRHSLWPVALWLFVPLWIWWLLSMQLSRYLLPFLILLIPAVAYLWKRLETTALRIIPLIWMVAALGIATYLAAPAMAVTCGLFDREAYLRAACQPYKASEVINEVVPPDGKVALFGEPRGFYIDREYLWADPGHHRLIPYSQFETGRQLIRHFRQMGITHVLMNRAQVGPVRTEGKSPVVYLYRAVEDGIVDVVTDSRLKRGPYLLLDIRAKTGQSRHPRLAAGVR